MARRPSAVFSPLLGHVTCRRSVAGVCALVAWLSAGVGAHAAEPDPWFGRDKAEHYSVSLMLAADGYAGMTACSERPAIRAVGGGGFALLAGITKEIYDESTGRRFSWRDLTWDALGTATGTLVALLIDRYFSTSPGRHP